MNLLVSSDKSLNNSDTSLYRSPVRHPDEVVDQYYLWLELHPNGQPYIYLNFRDKKLNSQLVNSVIKYNNDILHICILESEDYYPNGAPIRTVRTIEKIQENKTLLIVAIKKLFLDYYIQRDLLESEVSLGE